MFVDEFLLSTCIHLVGTDGKSPEGVLTLSEDNIAFLKATPDIWGDTRFCLTLVYLKNTKFRESFYGSSLHNESLGLNMSEVVR